MTLTAGITDTRTLANSLLAQGLSPVAVAALVRLYAEMSLEAGLVTVQVMG